MLHRWIASPIGDLLLVREGRAIVSISFPRGEEAAAAPAGSALDQTAFADVVGQLERYFRGELRSFELELAPRGTPFQLEVWNALRAIPYGSTTTYAKLAASIGRPAAVRAVGAANGANPIPIVIPCHRVIGANGSLTGFGGGLPAKRFLLDLETWV
jgi:methylated-DNA-[protein]-cysteine S-methyltransferase